MANQNIKTKPYVGPALKKTNFILIVIAFVLVVIGFILMSGGGSKNPNVFSWAIFSPRRLVVAPVIIISGYILGIIGILYNPKNEDK